MARAALRLTVADAAKGSRVSGNTINGFETEKTAPHPSTLESIRRAYEHAGVSFIENGVVYVPKQGELL